MYIVPIQWTKKLPRLKVLYSQSQNHKNQLVFRTCTSCFVHTHTPKKKQDKKEKTKCKYEQYWTVQWENFQRCCASLIQLHFKQTRLPLCLKVKNSIYLCEKIGNMASTLLEEKTLVFLFLPILCNWPPNQEWPNQFKLFLGIALRCFYTL